MRKQRTILVVEDEESIRKLVVHILESEGYRVLPARDSGDAFMTSENHAGPIHLLLTDILMDPHMDGIQLAQHLCILRPEMRVLYMSGYPKNLTVRANLEMSSEVFMAKPFTPETVRAKVLAILEDAIVRAAA